MENYIIRLGTPLISLPVDLILGYLASLCTLLLSIRFHEIGHWCKVKHYDKSAKPHIHQYWIYGFTYTDDIDTNGSTKSGYFQQLQERIDSYIKNKAPIPEQLCKEIIDNAKAGIRVQRVYTALQIVISTLLCYFFPNLLNLYVLIFSAFNVLIALICTSKSDIAIKHNPEKYTYNDCNKNKKDWKFILIAIIIPAVPLLFVDLIKNYFVY